ncbi:hypothetical protein QFZ48_005099 [Chitinophaga sp. W2I13]|uniref:hypothetical protein n=1 Tax=Chitinophaga sp. W2I13 TaxID=3373923 RepID=UPI003D204205
MMEDECYEESSSRKETFRGTIQFLKKKANEKGAIVTHSQIADRLNLSVEQFNAYYVSDEAPEELFPLLRSQYPDFIGNVTVEIISFTTIHYPPDPPTPDVA